MVQLTHSGKWCLAACAALYVASRTSQSGLLLFLIGLLLGCLVVNYFLARKTLTALGLEIPERIQLREGQPATQPWKIINRGRHPAGWGVVKAVQGIWLRYPALPSSGVAHVVPTLPFVKRGVYHHRDLCLETRYPFGFWQVQRPVQHQGEIVVYPAVYEVPSPRAAGYELMVGGKHHGTHRTTSGAHFAGVRPLAPGDPFKQVHWKSSAKGLGWMVKTFEEERAGRVALLMDGGHQGENEQFENCLRATASLILAALDAGQHVEWVNLGKLSHQYITPFTDSTEILETMARIKAAPESLTLERMIQAGDGISRRSAIALVLTDCPQDIHPAIHEWLRRGQGVSLYLPQGKRAGIRSVPEYYYAEKELVAPVS